MTESQEKSGFKIETSALRAYTMLGALIVIWLFFYMKTEGIFLSPLNLSNLMTQTSVTGILAVGMLMVIISGNIDLSVGSVLALAGGIAAIVLTGYGLAAAIAAAIVVCVAVGVFHGVLTAYGKIPAFIVTLGGLLAWRGAVKGITQSETIPIADPIFKSIGQSYIAPQVGWVVALVAIVCLLILAVRQIKQETAYGLSSQAAGYGIPLSSVALISGILGATGYFLPWAGVGGGTVDIVSFSGYRISSGIEVVSGVTIGGNSVLFLFPVCLGLAVATGALALFRKNLSSFAAGVWAIAGIVGGFQVISFMISYKSPAATFHYGSYISLFGALYVGLVGIYGLVQSYYLKTASEITPDNLIGLLVPTSSILVFMLVMNSHAGVPIPVMILLAVALIGVFITNSTTFGRYLYAIGGNADAARLSGINNKVNILKVYAVLGALTGVAAVIFTARLGSATPDAGVLKELDAIAACVIGGASLMGGRGTVFGACLGALIMASLDNGMSLLNVRDFMQELIKGGILVAAVGLDMIGRKD